MNCVDWEERIALYAGGDLAPVPAQAVECHIAECSGCQMLLGSLRANLSLVREAHGEPVDGAHFAAVRARVFAELERGPTRRWRFGWAYAMAAAAVVVLLMAVWPRPEQHMVMAMPHPPAAPVVAKVFPEPRRAKPRESQPSEDVLMKIETNNPDVVIYWIAETKGETK